MSENAAKYLWVAAINIMIFKLAGQSQLCKPKMPQSYHQGTRHMLQLLADNRRSEPYRGCGSTNEAQMQKWWGGEC
jgi:hypothetical protein